MALVMKIILTIIFSGGALGTADETNGGSFLICGLLIAGIWIWL